MPTTNDYYLTLKTQLDNAALAKKAAYDAQLQRATNAEFDSSGRISKQGTGTLDVGYQNQQRSIKATNEGGGMLRSGQNARNLADSEAAYRAQIGGAVGENTALKADVDTSTASQLAQYQAMYATIKPKKTTSANNKSTTASTAAGAGAGAAIGSGLAGGKTTQIPRGSVTPSSSRQQSKSLKPVNSDKINVKTMSPSVVAQYQRAYGR